MDNDFHKLIASHPTSQGGHTLFPDAQFLMGLRARGNANGLTSVDGGHFNFGP
jgi:hypothetical protein